MSAIAVQRKEGDKAVKAAVTLVPEPQLQESTETGATAGVPLFLQGGRQSGAVPPATPASAPRIQRQVEQEKKDEDDEDNNVQEDREVTRYTERITIMDEID